MKPTAALRFLCIASSALLSISYSQASTLYWDGGTVNIGTDGNDLSGGGTGNWNTTLTNWDAGAAPHVAWNNSNLDTAIFGATGITAGTATLTAPVTVGGLSFYNTGYTVAAGVQGLTFGAANNTVSLFSLSGLTTSATITGTVNSVSGGNVTFTSVNPVVASTLTFDGTSAGGWSGSTTINANTTLVLGATTNASTTANKALANTSAITLNGGGITINYASGYTAGRINTAPIAVNGGGTFTIGTSVGALTENIGAVTLNSGQLNFQYVNNPSSGGFINLASLTRSSTTSAVTFSGNFTGGSNFRVGGVSNTAAGEIIGPWATTGGQSGIAAQSDYAIYTAGDGTVRAANIAASAQSTWSTTHALASNYTLANAAGSAANGRLTGDRNINTLRANTAETGVSSVDITTDTITYTGHSFQNGDVVAFRNSGTASFNPVNGQPYYIRNVSGNTFQVSATPAGALLDLTGVVGTGNMNILPGVTLNGYTLGTYGILAANSGPTVVGGSGSITLPNTTSGNLYLTNGNASLWIDAPITNNGAGVLTLVKGGTSGNGSGNVTLTGTNTYTGGTIINSGTLSIGSASNIGGSGANLTFDGTGQLTATGTLSGLGTLTVNPGAVGTIVGNVTVSFTSTTGSGTLMAAPSGINGIVDLGDASGFTGTLQARLTGNHNIGTGSTTQIRFAKLSDTAGSAIQFAGGQSDGQQDMRVELYGNGGQLTFDNRQIQILPRTASSWGIEDNTLVNNNTNAAHTWVINTDLLMDSTASTSGTRYLTLSGSNTGDNAFNGLLMDGDHGVHPLGLRKTGTGKWIVSGNNTFTGDVNVSGGTLVLSGTNQYTAATTVTNGGTLSVNSVSDYGVASAIGKIASGSAILLGTGASLTGTLEYTGSGHSTNRQVQIGSIGASSGNGVILNNGTGALIFDATTFNVNDTTVAGSAGSRNLTLGGSYAGGVNEIQGAILANTGAPTLRDIAIIKNDIGTWSFAGANTYTGGNSTGNTINLGTLRGTQTSGTPFGTGAVTINAGTLSLAPTGSGSAVSVTGGTKAAGTLFTYTADAILSLNKGTQTSLTYTFGSSSAGNAFARGTNGTLILSTSNIANFGTAGSKTERFIINSGSTAPSTVSGIVSGVVIQDRNTSNAGDFAAYNGTDGFTKATYDGTDFSSTDNTKVLDIASASTGGPTAVYAMRVSGTVTNTGNTITLGNGSNPAALILNGGTISGGTLTKPNTSEYLIYTSGVSAISSTITSGTGSTGMSVFGPGSLDLTGSTNDVSGNLRINNSTVIANNNNQLGNTTSQINLVGGTLQTSGTVALGATNRAITLAAGQDQTGGTFNVTSGTTTYQNAASGTKIMSGSGSLTKAGAGILDLTGNTANTYTGDTFVNQGMLAISGTASINTTSAINVAAGATFAYNSSTALTVAPTLNGTGTGSGQRAILGGTGPINTAVTLDNLGDVLSPGNSPGIQTYTPAQTWSSFSYDWEVKNFTATTAGTDFDLLNLASTLNLTGGASAYQLNVLGLTAGDVSGLVPNFSEINRSWTILTSTGITGFNAANWTINTTGFTDPDAGVWSLAQSGNDLVLSYAAVPEPNVAALVSGLGLLALLRRRR